MHLLNIFKWKLIFSLYKLFMHTWILYFKMYPPTVHIISESFCAQSYNPSNFHNKIFNLNWRIFLMTWTKSLFHNFFYSFVFRGKPVRQSHFYQIVNYVGISIVLLSKMIVFIINFMEKSFLLYCAQLSKKEFFCWKPDLVKVNEWSNKSTWISYNFHFKFKENLN